MLIIGKFQ